MLSTVPHFTKKRGLREVKQLAYGYTAGKGQSQDLNLVLYALLLLFEGLCRWNIEKTNFLSITSQL